MTLKAEQFQKWSQNSSMKMDSKYLQIEFMELRYLINVIYGSTWKKNIFFRFSEFYNDDKALLDYNCPKKEDFIKKGIGKCYSKAEQLFNMNRL